MGAIVNKVQVLIADDHQTVREGLTMLIDREVDMEIVGEAADGNEAISKAVNLRPQVIVMDLSMPGMSGLNATRKLKEMAPEIHIVALTRHNEGGYLQELLKAGASGYVLKQSSSEELIRAIRSVVAGNSYLDPAVTGEMVKKYSAGEARNLSASSERLSQREEEVMRLIASGYSNKEIATRLDISVKTVEAHKANSTRKLGLKGRIDIVHYALMQGWLKSN
jgi:two-component system response regulator NreC